MTPGPILRVEQLGYHAGRRWLIKDVNFDLTSGFTALTGPNGAGKSTLLRTIASVFAPQRGRVSMPQVSGQEVARQIGYIPQFPGAYEHMTPYQFLLRTAWWDQPRNWGLLRGRANQVLEKLNLTSLRDRPGRELPMADRRRVALASVWMRNVRVVLLDEPTAGLDPQERLAFWQELYRLHRMPDTPEAYLITTHLLSEVTQYCDAILILDRGHVRHHGPVHHFIRTATGHTFIAPESDHSSTYIDTGRSSDEGAWVVAAKGTDTLTAREPDLLDAYLWTLYGSELRGNQT